METKAEIRKRILETRRKLTDDEAASKSAAIVQKVIKTPEYRRRTISCSMPTTVGK